MLILCDEVNILNTFRVMIILRLLLLLTNLHLKLLSTQGTGADKLLSTHRETDRPAARMLLCQRIFIVCASFKRYVICLTNTYVCVYVDVNS